MTTFATFGWAMIACGAVAGGLGLFEAITSSSTLRRRMGWGNVACGLGTVLWGASQLSLVSWSDDPGVLAWIGLPLMGAGVTVSVVMIGRQLWAERPGAARPR